MYQLKIIKRVLVLSIYISFSIIYSQTKIGFSTPYQTINSDVENIQVIIKNYNEKSSENQHFLKLRISHNDPEFNDLLIGVTNDKQLEFVIDTSNKENIIEIPISKNIGLENKELSLILEISEPSDNYEVIQSTQTLYFKEKSIARLGLRYDEFTVKLKESKNQIVEIPYEITSSLSLGEDTHVKIKLKGVENLSPKIITEYDKTFNGNYVNDKIIVKLDIMALLSKNGLSKEDIKLENKKWEKIKKDEQQNLIKNLLSLKRLVVEIDSVHINAQSQQIVKIDDLHKKKIIYVDRLLDKSSFSGNSYNFFGGTNFDLEDNLEANSFYSEIDIFLPDLSGKKAAKYGIRAGLYKTNSVSRLDNLRENQVVLEILGEQSNAEELFFERKQIQRVPSVSIENLGLFFEAFHTVKETVTDDFVFRFMIGPHVEVIQRTETTTFNNEDLFSLGVESILVSELATNQELLNSLITGNSKTLIVYDSYFALALPTIYQSKGIEILFNPFLGGGNPGLRNPDQDASTFTTFGAFQFYLIERSVGIKLSGEVRKYFARGEDAVISVNISKSINLKGLFEPRE